MPEAAIKGSAFESAVSDLLALLESGRVTRAELEKLLTPADLECLDERVLPSSWYPLCTYERLLDVLVAREAGGDREAYLRERGRKAAQRLYEAGLYTQLEATLERWGERFGGLMSTLGAAIFRDTRWSLERTEDPGVEHSRYRITVEVPAEFPECARHTAQGFIELLGSRSAGEPIRVHSERPSKTRLVFTTYRR